MKDLLIALAILLILVAVFSHYDVRPEGDTAPHADGTREQGESDTVIPSDEPTEFVEPPQSPQTGDRWWW